MRSDAVEKSTNIRNYAVAGACVLIMALVVFGIASIVWTASISGAWSNSVWLSCDANSANVFVHANQDLKGVSCRSLDAGVFQKDRIELGDLVSNNEDVCKFSARQPVLQPLRFEIRFNNQTIRRTCSTLPHTGFSSD